MGGQAEHSSQSTEGLIGNQGRSSAKGYTNTVISRHRAKGPDNGTDCKVRPGPGPKLTLSWITEDEWLEPEFAATAADEMGSC